MRRGFVITISTILLLMVILLFSQANQNRMREEQRAVMEAHLIDSAAYFFDDAAEDFRSMLGPAVEISRNSSESNITFRDRLPRGGGDGLLLSNYGEFVADYSNKTNSAVSLNSSNLENGRLIVFSNGLRYDRNSTSVRFYSSSGGTNATAYELSIFSNAYRKGENISSLSKTGSVRLTIHYSDLSGNRDVSGAFDPNAETVYSVNYTDSPESALLVRVGSSGSPGSVGVEQNGSVQTDMNVTATGGWSCALDYAYDVNMSYRQLNAAKEGLLWVRKG
ncbi:MAG: hypothetical protein Sv326_0585 [Candidatus Fermentimicrarchaeum limneticum]|uniref:Uncharacterized protein n=1 Tax=Fermentimicrarchaeum limneticum TaxID=2795018 RepID=A0A7D6BFG4_FERL1|nr:MAG: hypothetical protein Sv326_0585 [Candidatus Fermentimicrarchaeum limneticum]